MSPADPWRAFAATADDPWNLAKVAHLHRRAGFGGTGTELLRDVQAGPAASVDRFFQPTAPTEDERRIIDTLRDGALGAEDGERLKAWWLYQMVFGFDSLREKMTLFWHGHFATSNRKVQSLPLMCRQNELLRRQALGNFSELVCDIARDPAMLVWLDGVASKREKPNENFARELWELFTLGPGNYTEADIREAARAFTGSTSSFERAEYQSPTFRFDQSGFDDGMKTILGRTGRWQANDVVRMTLDQPAAAEFLCRKLYHYFVSETGQPDAQLIAPLAEQLRNNGYALRPTLETILGSQHFYSAQARRQRVSGPVEYSVGLVRMLKVARTDVRLLALAAACAQQGQDLFYPPSVKGWDGGRRWLNSATLVARGNWANDMIWGNPVLRLSPFDPQRWRGAHGGQAEPVEALIDLLLQDDVAPRARELIQEAGAGGEPYQLRQALQLIVCCTEFQLA